MPRLNRNRPLNDSRSSGEPIEDPTGGDDRGGGSGEHGVVPPATAFSGLRDAADQNGALLIFDEVIRVSASRAGAPRSGTESLPDLTIMGKIVGGGLPAAAYGGRAELMERIAPAGDVYQAGTLSGNPLAVAAALATLRSWTAPPTTSSRRPPSARHRHCATPRPPLGSRCRSRASRAC